MKKKIALLIACISLMCLSLMTGCSEAKVEADADTAAEYTERTDELFQGVFANTDEAEIDELITYYTETEDAVFLSLYQGWANEREKLGDYVGLKEVSVYESEESGIYAKSYACEITYEFSERDLVTKIVYTSEGGYDSIAIEGVYTLAEKIEKAVMNTILGMGTVFVVLILITFVISAFGLIGKLTAKKNQKEEGASGVQEVAPVSEEPVEVTDDYELIAVITAAIAAMEAESGASSDGLVVRSIRRVNHSNSKWRNA